MPMGQRGSGNARSLDGGEPARYNRSMNQTPVEIFAIGTELVIGRITDTNSQWLARQTAELGGSVRRITALIDDPDEITGALKDSLARGTRLILTSGGLGPTPDDLTVEAVARVLGRGTMVDEP